MPQHFHEPLLKTLGETYLGSSDQFERVVKFILGDKDLSLEFFNYQWKLATMNCEADFLDIGLEYREWLKIQTSVFVSKQYQHKQSNKG